MKHWLLELLLGALILTLMGLCLRGMPGNPAADELNQNQWKDDGPFELSPERGRYALTYSIIEDKSLFFSLPLAAFATPDLGWHRDKFVSLFAPGVSYFVIPGYLAGKLLGYAQVGTYAMIALAAVANSYLIRATAMKLGAGKLAATLGGLTFLFATPALAYGVSLYQHHLSTLIILLSLYALIRFKGWRILGVVFLLMAAAVPIDYPNLFLMLPIGFYAINRMWSWRATAETWRFTLRVPAAFTLGTMVVPISLFLAFNAASYGNPLQFSGTVASVKALSPDGKPVNPSQTQAPTAPPPAQKSAVSFFTTRNLLRGSTIHLFSPDRGILFFAPIVFIGGWGWLYLYRRRPDISVVMMGVVGINLILYSMWGDPWGGWAFGSRYLIPAYAMSGVGLAFWLDRFRRQWILLLIAWLITGYSSGVAVLGAITSNRNPPRQEAINLEQVSGRHERYGVDRNWERLKNQQVKALGWYLFGQQHLPSEFYFGAVAGTVMSLTTLLYLLLMFSKREQIYAKTVI